MADKDTKPRKNKKSLWRNPENPKYRNVSCFEIRLDRKEIYCRYCHKSEPLPSKYLEESAQEIIAFKKKHRTCAKNVEKQLKSK